MNSQNLRRTIIWKICKLLRQIVQISRHPSEEAVHGRRCDDAHYALKKSIVFGGNSWFCDSCLEVVGPQRSKFSAGAFFRVRPGTYETIVSRRISAAPVIFAYRIPHPGNTTSAYLGEIEVVEAAVAPA